MKILHKTLESGHTGLTGRTQFTPELPDYELRQVKVLLRLHELADDMPEELILVFLQLFLQRRACQLLGK